MSDRKALDPGTVIDRRYIIVAAEGHAGDCLHYRAEEFDTKAVRAIAEYFPDGIAMRTPKGAVAPASDAAAAPYEEGRRRFLPRAHGLARLAHPGLVPSRAPIEERNTAFAIIDPVDGPTLAIWARNLGRSPSQGELDVLLAPVLDALAALHGAGLLHLAISPDAIVLRNGREPVLTRLWAGALLPARVPHSADIDSGYAAPELLADRPSEIGTRTDIYGLAATIYALLTGTPPAQSTPGEGETWIPPAIPTSSAGYRPEFLQGVATSLAPDPSRRPPSAAALKSLLLDEVRAEEPPSIPETAPKTQASRVSSGVGLQASIAAANPPQRQQPRMRVPWVMILLLGGGILAGLSYLGMRPTLSPPKVETTPPPQRPTTAEANPAAPAAPEEPRRQNAANSILQRIAATTDRNELLRIADAEPTYRAEVEARLASLGYLRLVRRGSVVWLWPGRDESFSECDDCPEMTALPAATFLMGSPAGETGRRDDEDDTPGPGGNPVSVTLARPFAIGKYEVTRGQFAAFVKATGYKVDPGCYAREGRRQLRPELSWIAPGFEQDDRHPVTCISWQDAVAYIRWLSATTGAEYRLPTEAEWEYAARGGSTGRFGFGDEDVHICKYGNGADLTSREADPDWLAASCRDGFRFTAPVGSFTPNEFGLYDMHGNVWEWVEDCQSDSLRHVARPEASSGASRPCGSDAPRILRGGSWSDPPERLRSAARIAGPPAVRDYIVGFRVARSLELGR